MKKLLIVLIIFFCTNALAKYREYRIPEIPYDVSSLYLRDTLRYLSLATKSEAVINATYSGYSGITVKLLTFQKEGVRVMIIKDKNTNTQSINIIALHNNEDLYHAISKPMQKGKLFLFPVNEFYLNKYANIREIIIRNIHKGVVKINTLGSASAYGTLLAIELSSMQVPVDTVVMFGAVRFTTQDMHNKIAKTFKDKMISFTHESEVNYLTQLRSGYADTIPNEYIICNTPKCAGKIYELRHFSLNDLLRHFSETPQRHAEVYHDSLLKYNEK